MTAIPEGLKFSKSHEWVSVNGETATIGISDHAQAELGDVTYLDLPEPGRMLTLNSQFGEVESVKAVSELYSPISGEVVETNSEILNSTETVNEDPYDKGWLIKIRISDPAELATLMNAKDYEEFTAQGGH